MFDVSQIFTERFFFFFGGGDWVRVGSVQKTCSTTLPNSFAEQALAGSCESTAHVESCDIRIAEVLLATYYSTS